MLIHPLDNVEVNLADGHKYAARAIGLGEDVIKYGFPIGRATADILPGEHVHSHNLKTKLEGALSYRYEPRFAPTPDAGEPRSFQGYLRPEGGVGIRNDVWIVNTVGCVNNTAQILAGRTGSLCFPHPCGCSQMGEDQRITQNVLRGLVRHPNAGGVLVLGLGCENNNIEVFRKVLGEINPDRVKFLNTQDVEDEIAEGVRLIAQLRAYADTFSRRSLPASRLVVGLKCGGSDGLSGITANPLVGRFADRLCALGGSVVLTEVPEMFGAETLLMERCRNQEVFDKTVGMINGFKAYFARHGQVVYENPSPGNKEGGITTLEEKSLGCVQKSGSSQVMDVLDYGDTVTVPGLNLLNGPGNDIVSLTNLASAGCHLALFTTGRGTPLGGAVPTVKISSNTALAKRKGAWIDFDAQAQGDVFDFVMEVANGKPTRAEENGYREISIFRDGVTL